ncbi:MAG: acyltransferase [Bacteroidota bacterium]
MLKEKRIPPSLGYVPSLDGLRAIAVLMVMLLHAHFQLGKGGGLGVDMFFALSGFLITTLLLEENQKNNRISLGSFYIRRTFRLFPALYFMLLVVLIYALVFSNGAKQIIILKEVFASGVYVNNISYLWDFESLILAHTWSLGVEEQFYFVWPLLLMLSLRFLSPNKLLLALLFFIPLIWMIKITDYFPILWGLIHESLFIGCLFALLRWTGRLPVKIPNLVTLLFFIAAIVIGVFPITVYHDLVEYNLRFVGGLLSIIIIIGLVDASNSMLSKLLSSRFLVFIGKISYALYLWHVPVFRWFAWHSTLPASVAFILKFVVTFLIAIVSLELIEKRSMKIGRILSKKLAVKNAVEDTIPEKKGI